MAIKVVVSRKISDDPTVERQAIGYMAQYGYTTCEIDEFIFERVYENMDEASLYDHLDLHGTLEHLPMFAHYLEDAGYADRVGITTMIPIGQFGRLWQQYYMDMVVPNSSCQPTWWHYLNPDEPIYPGDEELVDEKWLPVKLTEVNQPAGERKIRRVEA